MNTPPLNSGELTIFTKLPFAANKLLKLKFTEAISEATICEVSVDAIESTVE